MANVLYIDQFKSDDGVGFFNILAFCGIFFGSASQVLGIMPGVEQYIQQASNANHKPSV